MKTDEVLHQYLECMIEIAENRSTDETYDDMDYLWEQLTPRERDIINKLAEYTRIE